MTFRFLRAALPHRRPALLPFVLLTFAMAADVMAAEPRADVPLRASGLPEGYLKKGELPNSALLLPPPPVESSPAARQNAQMHQRAQALRGSDRWALAARDANLQDGGPMDAFACALGVRVDATRTPRLYQLLYRTQRDASRSTEAAKKKYRFARPFVALDETTCTPERDEHIRAEGSYPSGHAATGWALALVLTELAPERTDALLARGRAYGESRMICNAHWQTDVLQGRVMASATVARLHAEADFREDLRLSRAELDALRQHDLSPPPNCEAEARTLARGIPGAL
ncbi:acid phosphatase [Xanthobacter sp. TB0139]|uniref:acid phosphatase n=1 Tax=Xanthobacter sp. TB0139 TaxID=3459178 RepID=UPI00403990D9